MNHCLASFCRMNPAMPRTLDRTIASAIPRKGESWQTRGAMAEYTWDVRIPGTDLPHRLATDYVLGEGERITIDGRAWLVEHVEIDETAAEGTGGVVDVVEPHEPAGL